MILDKVFNNGSDKICGMQPSENLKLQVLHVPFLNNWFEFCIQPVVACDGDNSRQ